MYRVWSINTARNKLLWFMGEFTNPGSAMSRAEQIISDSNPDVGSVRYEHTCVKDRQTGKLTDGVLCLSPDEVIGAVVSGLTVDDLQNISQWPGCVQHEDELQEFEHD